MKQWNWNTGLSLLYEWKILFSMTIAVFELRTNTECDYRKSTAIKSFNAQKPARQYIIARAILWPYSKRETSTGNSNPMAPSTTWHRRICVTFSHYRLLQDIRALWQPLEVMGEFDNRDRRTLYTYRTSQRGRCRSKPRAKVPDSQLPPSSTL
jgi:hypothetical protein